MLGVMTETASRATELLRLHTDPALLTVVNVWDAITARVVAGEAGTRALATASHSIAAGRGYPDGEKIGVDEMVEECRRIVAAVELPVSADLEGGYGNAAETIRKAIGVGVVGANIEDQLKPVGEAAEQVEAVMAAAAAEGVPDFVLNARTDAFLRAGDATRPPSSRTRPNGPEHSSTPVRRSFSSPGSSPRRRSCTWSTHAGRSG